MIKLALLILTAAPAVLLAGNPKLGSDEVERLLENSGGRQRWKALRSAMVKGRFDIGGARGDYVETWTPDASRQDLILDCGATKTSVSSKNPWEREFNGDLWLERPSASAPRRRTTREAVGNAPTDLFDFMQWLAGERFEASSATARGRSTVAVLSAKGVKPFELWTRDGLAERIVAGEGREPAEASFGDYHSVDGLRFPYEQEFRSKFYASTFTVQEVQLDPPLPAGVFDPEPEKPPEAFAPVKLRLIKDGALWYLPGWLDSPDEGGYFLVDTGSPVVAVAEEALPRSARRCPLSGLNLIGTGAVESTALVRLADLHLGSFTISGLWALAVPMESMSGFTDIRHRRVLGILGNDVFRRYALRIDPVEKTLTLMPRGTEPAEKGVKRLPLRFEHNHPMVSARMHWHKGLFLADTGMTSTVINPGFAQRAGISPRKNETTSDDFVGLGGSQTVRTAGNVTLRLGPLKRKGLRIGVKESDDEDSDGVLGHEIWDNAVSWWDYSKGTLGIKPIDAKDADYERYADEVSRIDGLLDKKEARRALEALARLRARFPEKLELLAQQIRALHFSGQSDEAEDLFKEELARRPDDAELLFLHVRYLNVAHHPGALAVAAPKLLGHPDFQNDRMLLRFSIQSLFESGLISDSLKYARRAHRLYPRDQDLSRLLGLTLSANHLWSEAEPLLRGDPPDNPGAAFLTAQAQAATGHMKEAVMTLEKALSSIEAGPEAWSALRDKLFSEPGLKALRKSAGFNDFLNRLNARLEGENAPPRSEGLK